VLKTENAAYVVGVLIVVLDVSFVLKYGLDAAVWSIHAVLVPVELNT
jgi:hypothetical protein